MPVWLNDALSLLLALATAAAVVFMYRRGQANRAALRGKRQIDDE